MISLGYKQTQESCTLFVKHSETWEVTTLLSYVDNIFVTGDNKKKMMLKQCLTREFKIKELHKLKYFLKIEVIRPKF